MPAEDTGRGAHPVAVLSWSTWKGAFGGDPKIVGRSIILNGRSYSVIGVDRLRNFVVHCRSSSRPCGFR